MTPEKFKNIPLSKKISDSDPRHVLFEKWRNRLGLQNQPMGVLYEGKGDNQFSKSGIAWHPHYNKWEIQYKYPQDDFIIIHELGHLYLALELGDIGFLKHDLFEGNDLTVIVNVINDQFVNYRLSKFGDFYEILAKKAIDFVKNRRINDKPEISLSVYIRLYFQLYLQFNFILNSKDKKGLETIAKNHFKNIRGILFKKYKAKNIKFFHQNFQKLDAQLNKFRVVKDTKNSQDVVTFFYDTLYLLKLWDPAFIKEILKRGYGK